MSECVDIAKHDRKIVQRAHAQRKMKENIRTDRSCMRREEGKRLNWQNVNTNRAAKDRKRSQNMLDQKARKETMRSSVMCNSR